MRSSKMCFSILMSLGVLIGLNVGAMANEPLEVRPVCKITISAFGSNLGHKPLQFEKSFEVKMRPYGNNQYGRIGGFDIVTEYEEVNFQFNGMVVRYDDAPTRPAGYHVRFSLNASGKKSGVTVFTRNVGELTKPAGANLDFATSELNSSHQKVLMWRSANIVCSKISQ